MMGEHRASLFKLGIFTMVAVVCVLLPRIGQVVFPMLPLPSAAFDCDDDTLMMYRHFRHLGIESVPMVGNLEMDGEAFEESDHVWLMVKAGPTNIAYDWGVPRFDPQHYEGYPISLDYLLNAVAEDGPPGEYLAAAAP